MSEGPEHAVRLVPTDDGALWDRLVAAQVGATAFFDWAWLDFQSELLGVVVERLIVTTSDGPVGVFAVPRRSARSVGAPSLPFPYVGPLVPAPLLIPAVQAFRRWQRRAGLVLARFDLSPAGTTPGTVEALDAAGIDVHQDSTVVVDVAHHSLEQLHKGYSRVRHRNIRRALSAGAAVRPARPGEFAAVMPQVLDESYGAHGVASPYPRETGARVEAWAADRPWVHVWVATVDDEPVGGQVMLGAHPTAVAWIGGCLRAHRDVNPNVLLYDQVLVAAVENGHDCVDFSGWVDDGVGSYKLAFGGQRRPYLSLKSGLGPALAHRVLRRARTTVRERRAT